MSDAPRFYISPHHGAPTSFGRWYFITDGPDGPALCDVVASTHDECLTRARLICSALNAAELRELATPSAGACERCGSAQGKPDETCPECSPAPYDPGGEL